MSGDVIREAASCRDNTAIQFPTRGNHEECPRALWSVGIHEANEGHRHANWLRLDRFIGEVDDARNGKAHLISVFGGDSDVGAIWAAVAKPNTFTVEAPGIQSVIVTLGEDALCFRGTLNIASRKPIRHLVQSRLSWPIDVPGLI